MLHLKIISLAQPLLLIITQDIFKTYEKRKNDQPLEKPFFCDDYFFGV
jgi:hypothetical protein